MIVPSDEAWKEKKGYLRQISFRFCDCVANAGPRNVIKHRKGSPAGVCLTR